MGKPRERGTPNEVLSRRLESLEFRIYAVRLTSSYVLAALSLASTHAQATCGIARVAQGSRPAVAFTAVPSELRSCAFSYLGGLLRTSSFHGGKPRAHGR